MTSPRYSGSAFSLSSGVTATLKNTPAVEKKDEYGNTPLLIAACEGSVSTVKALLAAGADPLTYNEEGWTPLHYAAANGHEKVAELLIGHDLSCLKQSDYEGRTPLHRACNHGRENMVKLLLRKGAPIEAVDDKGKTPLHSAVSRGGIDNTQVINLLLLKGADIEAKTPLGWRPLHSAARYSDPVTVAFLIKNKASFEAKDDYGQTPLNLVASEKKMDIQQKQSIMIALLENGADIHTQDNGELTPLHWACAHGELPIVRFLIKKGANSDALTKEGKTPLHLAAKYDHESVVLFLTDLKNSSFLNKPAESKRGSSTFSAATSAEHPKSSSGFSSSAAITSLASLTTSSTELIELLRKQQQQLDELQKLIKKGDEERALLREEVKSLQAAQDVMRGELKGAKETIKTLMTHSLSGSSSQAFPAPILLLPGKKGKNQPKKGKGKGKPTFFPAAAGTETASSAAPSVTVHTSST